MKLEPGLMALVNGAKEIHKDVIRNVDVDVYGSIRVELDVEGWAPLSHVIATRYACGFDNAMHWVTLTGDIEDDFAGYYEGAPRVR